MIKKSFCELFILNYSIPVRALIAKKLMEKYGYSQLEASRLAGISQPLLNMVLQGKRHRKDLERILSLKCLNNVLDRVADMIVMGADVDLCTICTMMRPLIEGSEKCQ